MKYRAHLLALNSHDHDWSGVFNSEEEARTALDRSQYFRVRVNSVRVDCVYVLEEIDRLSPKLSPNGLTDSHLA